MRNAALTLGIIAGIVGMIVGVVSYGYSMAIDQYGPVDGLFEQFSNPQAIRIMSVLAPLLAIAGGAMAGSRALWGGVLMLVSAAGMFYAFGFNAFTMFPIAFAGVGGLLGVAAGKPDEPKAHF